MNELSYNIIRLGRASLLPFPDLFTNTHDTLPESTKAARIKRPGNITPTKQAIRQQLSMLPLYKLARVSQARTEVIIGTPVPDKPSRLGLLILRKALEALHSKLGLNLPNHNDEAPFDFAHIGRHTVSIFAQLNQEDATPTIDSAWENISAQYTKIANAINRDPTIQREWVDYIKPLGVNTGRDYFKVLQGLSSKQPSLFPDGQFPPPCSQNKARHTLAKRLAPPHGVYDPSYHRIGEIIYHKLVVRRLDPSSLSPNHTPNLTNIGQQYQSFLPKQLALCS